MWTRLLVVLTLMVVGVWATMGSAASAPNDAPVLQITPPTSTPLPVASSTPLPAASSTPLPPASPTTAAATLTATPLTITPLATATQTGLVDLTIFKTASPDIVNTGDTLTYSITVTNANSFAGATSPPTTMTDFVPTGTTLIGSASGGAGCTNSSTTPGSTITCQVPTLGPNQSITFTFAVQVTAGSGTVISNTANVDSNNSVVETNEGNNTATINTTVGLTPVPTTT